MLAAVKAGSTVFELCELGDNTMTAELKQQLGAKAAKGIAFPTCVNPNHIPAHLSPENASDLSNLTLQDGDVVNVMLGVHVDGYPAIVAGTVVVGASSENHVTGEKADLMQAAWNASEAAIRTLKKGARNWDVTNVVDKVTKDFGTTAVQLMLSHNHERNVIYGPKEIIINPAKQHKLLMETHRVLEGDVFGLDILVLTLTDGKVKKSMYKTTLHKLTGNKVALRMALSRAALKTIQDSGVGMFPANVKVFEDPRKVRVGLIECSSREVVLPYEVMEGKTGEFIAQFFTTVAVTPTGLVKYTSAPFDASLYESDKKVTDDELAALIATPWPSKKKSKKKSKAAAK